MTHPQIPVDLFPDVDTVRSALKNCEATSLDIYIATNLAPAWQHAVSSGRIGDPGYARIVKLIKYFTENHPNILAKD